MNREGAKDAMTRWDPTADGTGPHPRPAADPSPDNGRGVESEPSHNPSPVIGRGVASGASRGEGHT